MLSYEGHRATPKISRCPLPPQLRMFNLRSLTSHVSSPIKKAAQGRRSLIYKLSSLKTNWFTYTPRGEVKESWESTPHSGGYYHPTSSYWETGNVQNLWMSGIPSIAFGTDGEGRVSTVTPSTGQVPVTTAAYIPAGQATGVTFGSADHDDFTYDSNAGRMKTYKFTVGSNNENGTLTWSPNGTLKTLAIVDPWTSADNQTCNYAYDDLARLTSANCATAWSQTFTYDPFGNISKSGSSSFQAGYTPASGPPNNRIQSLPGCTPVWNPATNYDAMGNLLYDCTHHYTWDSDGRVASIDSTTFNRRARPQRRTKPLWRLLPICLFSRRPKVCHHERPGIAASFRSPAWRSGCRIPILIKPLQTP